MPEHEPQVPAERLPGGLDHGMKRPAVGTLVVAVLHQGDARIGGPQHVVALA